jgi:recombination protein RecT
MTQQNNGGEQLPLDEKQQTPAVRLKKFQEETVSRVLDQVNEFNQTGELNLPEKYSPGNALKSAWLILLETKDNKDKPVLETCSKESICNALLDMVVQGLSPMKKQCAFIAYGGKLQMQREYHGTIALAKRYGGVKHVRSNIIYEGDDFQYEIEPNTGLKRVLKHEPSFENINNNKIRGAYATVILNDGTVDVEIMTIHQIRTAWEMGYGGGSTKAHKNFPEEMARKTVINRACKLYISSSDDGGLVEGRTVPEGTDRVKEDKKAEVKNKANKKKLDIEDAEEVKDPESGEKESENNEAEEIAYQEAMAEANAEEQRPGF